MLIPEFSNAYELFPPFLCEVALRCATRLQQLTVWCEKRLVLQLDRCLPHDKNPQPDIEKYQRYCWLATAKSNGAVTRASLRRLIVM